MLEYAENNLLTSNMVEHQEQNLDPKFKIILLLQNSIKAYTYLITWFMSDNSKLKDNRDIALSKKNRKKNAPSPANEQDMNAILMANKECLKIFISLIDTNFHFFWPEHKIDEDFVNLFIRTGFDMLENPNNIKNTEIKGLLFDMMQGCMEKYGSQMKYMLG